MLKETHDLYLILRVMIIDIQEIEEQFKFFLFYYLSSLKD